MQNRYSEYIRTQVNRLIGRHSKTTKYLLIFLNGNKPFTINSIDPFILSFDGTPSTYSSHNDECRFHFIFSAFTGNVIIIIWLPILSSMEKRLANIMNHKRNTDSMQLPLLRNARKPFDVRSLLHNPMTWTKYKTKLESHLLWSN